MVEYVTDVCGGGLPVFLLRNVDPVLGEDIQGIADLQTFQSNF